MSGDANSQSKLERFVKAMNFEVVGSISAIILSIVALYIAWDQSNLMRVQQHASVMPIVDVEVTLNRTDEDNFLSIDVKNVGVGPALVRSAFMTINGKNFNNLDVLREELLVEELTDSITIMSSAFLDVLGAGENNTVLRFSWPLTEEYNAGFVKLAEKFIEQGDELLDIDLCYCSVFERCWMTSDNVSVGAQPVESCPVQSRDLASQIVSSGQDSKEN